MTDLGMNYLESARCMSSLEPDRYSLLRLLDLVQSLSAISSVTGLHDLLPHLARMLASSVGSRRCSIVLYSADRTEVLDSLRWGYTQAEMDALAPIDDLVGRAERFVLETREALVRIPGQVQEELLPSDVELRDTNWRGDVVVPLIWNDHVEGVAVIHLPHEAEHFDPLHLDIAMGVAGHAAGAIHRLRAKDAQQQARAQTNMLLDLNRIFSNARSRDEIYSALAEAVRSILETDAVSIVVQKESLLSNNPSGLRGVAMTGMTDAEISVRDEVLRSQARFESTVDQIARERGGPTIIDALDRNVDDQRLLASFAEHGVSTLLAAPIEIAGELHGMVYSWSRDGRTPDSDDCDAIVETMILNAAASIERLSLVDVERQQRIRTETRYRAGVEALAAAVDVKDSYTHSHSRHVAALSKRTAEALGLDPEEVERIELAALLHDVGKIGIPDHILTKPGSLDSQERLVMISHATLGARIVSAHPSLSDVARLVQHHHEWHNGSGYPDGLRAADIPIGSAIIAVADAFDSMTSHRPYRRMLSYDEARAELSKGSGTQFHPQVVETFLALQETDVVPEQQLLFGPSLALDPIRAVDIIVPRLMSQVAAEIGGLTDLYRFLDRLQFIVRDELTCEEVHIFLKDDVDDQLVLAASTTQSGLVGRLRIFKGDGIVGHAAQDRQVVNCGDVLEDPRARFTDLGSRSVLAAPLIVNGLLVGVLSAGSSEANRFEERDVVVMDAIAREIAPAVMVSSLHDHARRAATIDGLTGVMNHRAFYSRLESMIAELDHWSNDLHLLIVDVIGLKAVNDVYGHLAGDRALIAIANALKSRVRNEDEIARYGGDEFVVIVRGTPRGGLDELVERITAPVEFVLDTGYEMSVRLRCGVATATSAIERAPELVARADASLYSRVAPTERDDEF
jgi:diguanylate cyclase (GGDEF)-like protein/putative nucleotidyltransferase with HDIG domain